MIRISREPSGPTASLISVRTGRSPHFSITRCDFFIANEVIGPNCVGFKIVAGMLDKALKGLRSVAVAPVLLSINIQRNMRCRTRDTGNLHAF